MPSNSLSFEELIAPVEPENFVRDYWERKPLRVHRNSPNYFLGLLSLEDVDEVLARCVPRSEQIRIVRDGRTLSLQELKNIEGRNDLEAVYSQFRSGSTLVLETLHERWTPLWRLCDSVSRALGVGTQVNVYLTPAAAQGFNAHYDTHDVFVLQMAGTKKWRVSLRPQVALPLGNQSMTKEVVIDSEEMREFTLAPGDLLYIPRGFGHEAASEDKISLHATLGMHTVSWANVIRRAVDEVLKGEVRFRESLPSGLAVDTNAFRGAESHLEDLLTLLYERLKGWGIVEAAADLYEIWPPSQLGGHLRDLDALDSIDSETILQRRPDFVSNLVHAPDTNDPFLSLNFNGKSIRMPIHTEKSLEFILKSKGPFAIRNLPRELDDPGKLVLVRTLVREGFLAVCRVTGGPGS